MIVGDARTYLTHHFKEFEFIWGSPECQTHSRMRYMKSKVGTYPPKLPDFIQDWADCMTKLDLYYLQNVDEYLSLVYSEGYNQHDNEGLGGQEQYDNEGIMDYTNAGFYYHLLMVRCAVDPWPQIRLTRFLPAKDNGSKQEC